jgi:hypothetical protein
MWLWPGRPWPTATEPASQPDSCFWIWFSKRTLGSWSVFFSSVSEAPNKWEIDAGLVLFFFPIYGQHFHELLCSLNLMPSHSSVSPKAWPESPFQTSFSAVCQPCWHHCFPATKTGLSQPMLCCRQGGKAEPLPPRMCGALCIYAGTAITLHGNVRDCLLVN